MLILIYFKRVLFICSLGLRKNTSIPSPAPWDPTRPRSPANGGLYQENEGLEQIHQGHQVSSLWWEKLHHVWFIGKYIYIYIEIYREREREIYEYSYLYVYIYIPMHPGVSTTPTCQDLHRFHHGGDWNRCVKLEEMRTVPSKVLA